MIFLKFTWGINVLPTCKNQKLINILVKYSKLLLPLAFLPLLWHQPSKAEWWWKLKQSIWLCRVALTNIQRWKDERNLKLMTKIGLWILSLLSLSQIKTEDKNNNSPHSPLSHQGKGAARESPVCCWLLACLTAIGHALVCQGTGLL